MAVEILVLLISLGALAAGWGYVRASRRMRTFATTHGTVIGREVVRVEGLTSREGRWGRGGGYRPKVTYTYVVDGQTHTCDRWSYATTGLKHDVAAKTLAAVPEQVEVHYDPTAPQEAYLQTHPPRLGYALIVGGLFGVLASAAALFS